MGILRLITKEVNGQTMENITGKVYRRNILDRVLAWADGIWALKVLVFDEIKDEWRSYWP